MPKKKPTIAELEARVAKLEAERQMRKQLDYAAMYGQRDTLLQAERDTLRRDIDRYLSVCYGNGSYHTKYLGLLERTKRVLDNQRV